jgi:glucokinase
MTKYLEDHKSPAIDKLTGGNYSLISLKLLFDAAESGDKTAIELWNDYGEKLGILLADIINFVNPDTIIFCGGVNKSSKYFMDAMSCEIKERAYASAVDTCKIIVSQNTNKVGVIGAAMLCE